MLMEASTFRKLARLDVSGREHVPGELWVIVASLEALHRVWSGSGQRRRVKGCADLWIQCGNFVRLNRENHGRQAHVQKAAVRNLSKQVMNLYGRLKRREEPDAKSPFPVPPPLPPIRKRTPPAVGRRPPVGMPASTNIVRKPLPVPRGKQLRVPEFGTRLSSRFEALCRKSGARVVQGYSQTYDSRLGEEGSPFEDELISSGWCAGMVVHWLGALREETPYWAWALSDAAIPKFRFVMAFQDMWSSEVGGLKTPDSLDLARYSAMGLRRGAALAFKDFKRQPSGADIVKGALRADAPYAMVGLLLESGNHITGLYRIGPEEYRFFDPNYGEVHVRGRARLAGFLDGLFAFAYPDLMYGYVDLYTEKIRGAT